MLPSASLWLAARYLNKLLVGMHEAHAMLTSGHRDFCVVGGVDSYLEPATLNWLQENQQLLSEGVRSGFPPGEAAAMVVLANERGLRQRRLESLGLVCAVGLAQETKLIKTDTVNLGEGLTHALLTATAELRASGEQVDEIFCDINGERFRSEEWGFAALRVHQALRDAAQYRSAVNCWGDVGAASAALLTVWSTQAFLRKYARGARALVWASSEKGLRAAALLERSAKKES